MTTTKRQAPTQVGPTQQQLVQYAQALAIGDKTVVETAMDVFGWKKSYAEKAAYKWKRDPIVVAELSLIEKAREEKKVADKEDKLHMNRVMMEEAFRRGDYDAYAKLAKLDNDMQGHTKSNENDTDKTNAVTGAIFELMKQIRAENAKPVLDV